jgi:ASC-1-like (ASCH) protein
MEHLAIMKKEWRLIEKILSGEKKIESRWYKFRRDPWDRIAKGDVVYFKNSGEPVTVKADVESVIQFQNMNPKEVNGILEKYGDADGIGAQDIKKFFGLFKDKRYCILIFLKDAKRVEPFGIDKSGFGIMSSWITLKSISEITKS